LLSRSTASAFSVIALNFTDSEATVPFVFPRAGAYVELLHGQENFTAAEGDQRWLTIPSNYGRMWKI